MSYRLFGFKDLGGAAECASLNVGCARQCRQQFRYLQWVAFVDCIPAFLGRRCSLAENGRWCHLTARHSKYGVVYEDNSYLFASVGCVNYLSSPNRRKVPITLIGKDYFIRVGPFHTRGNRRCSAVRHLDHIDIEIVISQNGASDRGYADGTVSDVQFIDCFSYQTVSDAVPTTWAVMCYAIFNCGRSCKYCFHTVRPPFFLRFTGIVSCLIFSRTWSTVGTPPPARP